MVIIMDENEIRKMCQDLLETGWPAYLTTIDDKGYPQTRAMFNLRNKKWFPKLIPFFEQQKDEFVIIFSTNTSSTKVEDIRLKPKTSVYYCNPEVWQGVMFGGDIEIVDDLELKKNLWQDGWEKYYPAGYDDPDHSVLRIIPAIARGWTGSMTFRLEMGDTE
jgi:general stress protein 26